MHVLAEAVIKRNRTLLQIPQPIIDIREANNKDIVEAWQLLKDRLERNRQRAIQIKVSVRSEHRE